MPSDTRTACLFQCGNENLFAVSPDKTGKAIPRSSCTQAGYSDKNSSWARRSRCPLLSSPSPSFEASTSRATTSGAWASDK
jgi:hypothetical protein